MEMMKEKRFLPKFLHILAGGEMFDFTQCISKTDV